MRKLASIQIISNIEDIPNADRIKLASFKSIAWKCIVKNDEFKIGDKAVYVEIDSLLPDTNPVFEFMSKYKYRVKTIKLKGTLSQGLALPLNIFQNISSDIDEGSDVTEILGIKKYDEEDNVDLSLMSTNTKRKSGIMTYLMRYKIVRDINAKYFNKPSGNFPTHLISKTDETRIQAMPEIMTQCAGEMFFVTEKLEGSSATYILEKRPIWGFNFYVCSRNICYPTKVDNNYWKMAEKYNIKQVLLNIFKKFNMRSGEYVVLQGEMIGTKICGNIYNMDDVQLRAFRLGLFKNRETPIHLFTPTSGHSTLLLCSVGENNIRWVPYIWHIHLGKSRGFTTIDEILSYAENKSELYDTDREGIVVSRFDGKLSFKAVSNRYLLNKKG